MDKITQEALAIGLAARDAALCDDVNDQIGAFNTGVLAVLDVTHPPATDVAALVEAVRAYHRLLLPIYMSLAEHEMVDEPLSDYAVLFSFMGSGASDTSTVGDFRKADELARQALAPFTKGQNDD